MGMSYECQIYVKNFDIDLTVQPWLTFTSPLVRRVCPHRKESKRKNYRILRAISQENQLLNRTWTLRFFSDNLIKHPGTLRPFNGRRKLKSAFPHPR